MLEWDERRRRLRAPLEALQRGRYADPSNPIRVMPAEGAEMRDKPSHIAADILMRLRAQSPRVHCITNAVAQHFTANTLLAAD